MSGDLLLNLAVNDTNQSTVLDTNKTDIIFASKILHATISYFILEKFDDDPQSASVLVVPYFASENYEGTSSNIVREFDPDGQVNYLSLDELINLIKAVLVLEIDDFSTVNSLEIETLIANPDAFLNSAILHATISKQILDLDESSLAIPEKDALNNDLLIETTTPGSSVIRYIKKSELLLTLDALEELDINDFENPDIGVDILNEFAINDTDQSTVLDTDKTEIIFKSKIIHATISKLIRDAAAPDEITGKSDITIPTYAFDNYDSGSDELIITTDTSDIYIIEDELNHLFQAYLLLDIDDFSEVDTLDLSLISSNIGDLLESAMLHATITKLILEAAEEDPVTNESDLIVPYFATDNYGISSTNVVRDTVKSTDDYITKLELYELFEALTLLGIDDFTAVDSLTLADINLYKTDLLESSILHATVSKQVIELGESDDLVFPQAYFIDNTYSTEASLIETTGLIIDETDTEFIIKVELINTLEALDILEIQDLNNVNIDASILKKLSIDEVTNPTELSVGKINTLLSSKIVHATISKVIKDAAEVDANTGESDITLPTYASEDYAYGGDELIKSTSTLDDYIVEDELIELFAAYLLLDINDFSEVESLDLTIIASNTVELLESAILHATISNIIIKETVPDVNTGESSIILPYFATSNYPTTTTNVVRETVKSTDDYITKLELYELFEALELLGIDDFNAVESSLSLTNMINNSSDLLESAILHATMSDSIIEENTGGDIIVPYEATDNYLASGSNLVRLGIDTLLPDTSTHTDTYITKDEFNELFEALQALGVTDFADVSTILLSDIINNKTALLESAIMHATISQQVIDLETSNPDIIVPDKDQDGIDLILIDSNGENAKYIRKTELEATFDAFDLIGGINNLNDFNGSINLNIFYESQDANYDGNQDTLLASSIMQATISLKLQNLETDNILLIPSTDVLANAIEVTHGTDYYVFRSEIKNLINVLDIFGISTMESFAGSISIASFTSVANQNKLFDSAIMHMTVSDQIISNNSITVPEESLENDLSNNVIRLLVSGNEFIDHQEVRDLIKFMNLISAGNIGEFSGDINLSLFDSDTYPNNQKDLLTSAIMHATISKQIIDLATASTIIVPHLDYSGSQIRYTVTGTQQAIVTDYLIKAEVGYLIDGLNRLGLGNSHISSFDGNFNVNELTDSTVREDVLLSATLHATLSDKIDNGSLIVPDRDITDTYDIKVIRGTTTYIEKDEVGNLIAALDEFGVTDFTSGISSTSLTALSSEQLDDIILESAIMYLTIEDIIKENGNTIVIPDFVVDDLFALTDIIIETEIINFILAMNALGETDIANTTISFAAITSLNTSQQGIILDSAIVRATITPDVENVVSNANSDPFIPDYTGIWAYESDGITLTKLSIEGVINQYY